MQCNIILEDIVFKVLIFDRVISLPRTLRTPQFKPTPPAIKHWPMCKSIGITILVYYTIIHKAAHERL